jgi:hypothetical protein
MITALFQHLLLPVFHHRTGYAEIFTSQAAAECFSHVRGFSAGKRQTAF